MKKNPKRGGFREGAGRKPLGDKPFDAALIVKCSAAEKAAWQEKAAAEKKPLARIIRDYLNRWSRK